MSATTTSDHDRRVHVLLAHPLDWSPLRVKWVCGCGWEHECTYRVADADTARQAHARHVADELGAIA